MYLNVLNGENLLLFHSNNLRVKFNTLLHSSDTLNDHISRQCQGTLLVLSFKTTENIFLKVHQNETLVDSYKSNIEACGHSTNHKTLHPKMNFFS